MALICVVESPSQMIKKIGRGIVYVPQIQFYNVFTFDVLNCVDDQVVEGLVFSA